jgi:hypothetical protein
MGQYYKPINVDKQQYVYSHNIKHPYKMDNGEIFQMGTGLKLMEHSWRKNDFVNAVAGLIAKGGAWHGDRLVWAGDYADPEKGKTKREKNYEGKMETRKLNLYDLVDDEVDPAMKIIPEIPKRTYRYFLNLDTNEFVDINKCPEEEPEHPGWNIHPLPLLTCEGNGRGGGDFHKDHPMVGKWARNRIEASYTKPKGATEIFPNFTERDKVAVPVTKTTGKSVIV